MELFEWLWPLLGLLLAALEQLVSVVKLLLLLLLPLAVFVLFRDGSRCKKLVANRVDIMGSLTQLESISIWKKREKLLLLFVL